MDRQEVFELIRDRLAEIREAGVTVAGALSPHRTAEFSDAVIKAGVDLFVIRGNTVFAEHVSDEGREPLNLKQFIYELDVPVIVGGAATYQSSLHLMRTGAAGVLVGFGGGASSTTPATSPSPSAPAPGRRGLETLHAHLSGIDYGPRGERCHLPLNECDLKYRDLLQAMIDFDARGTIAVEAPIPFHVADALTLQATYRRLRDSQADDGAEESADAEAASGDEA